MFGGYAPGPPYHYLDSSEKYDPILGSWTTTAAKLPQPMRGLRATNIDARVLIFGTDILLTYGRSKIFQVVLMVMNLTQSWSMTQRRTQ